MREINTENKEAVCKRAGRLFTIPRGDSPWGTAGETVCRREGFMVE